MKLRHRDSRRSGRFVTTSKSRPAREGMERLEDRRLLAAHIGPQVFATIQAAVNAATPGATINVDPGTYSELVTVSTPGITIRGAQAGVDARTRSGSSESVVDGFPISPTSQSSAFYIAANDVTIDGFTVQGNTSSGKYGAGIVIAPGESGTHVLNDIVQYNIVGLYLANASGTDPALIRHNVFHANNNAGANSGRAIYSDGGVAGAPGTPLTNVLIDGNAFTQNLGGAGSTGLEAAIGLEAALPSSLQTNITITNNVMSGNGKGVLMMNVSNVTIAGNTITGSQDTGSAALRFEGNASNVTIQNNTVANNLGAAVRIDNKGLGTGTNAGFVVTGNNFYSNAAGGLIVAAGQYTGVLDARNNWWGSAAGPAINGVGPGDALFAGGNSVLFAPFSTALIAGAGPISPPPSPTPSGIQSSITTNFNAGSPAIAGGNYLWFNAVLKPSFSGPGPVTIAFVKSTVALRLADGSTITAAAPNAILRFSPSTTVATTSFDSASNTWITNLPKSGTSGNDFLDGFAFRLPAGIGPHDLKGATWTGSFETDSAAVSLNWQFGVAVYNSHFLDGGYAGLGVKASDDNRATPYDNSDHAGTPESELANFLGNGGTGGGGSNFTGSYSGTARVKISPASSPPITPGGPPTTPAIHR